MLVYSKVECWLLSQEVTGSSPARDQSQNWQSNSAIYRIIPGTNDRGYYKLGEATEVIESHALP